MSRGTLGFHGLPKSHDRPPISPLVRQREPRQNVSAHRSRREVQNDPVERTSPIPAPVHIGCDSGGHGNRSASFSDGDIQPRVCRGRPLSWWAAKSRFALGECCHVGAFGEVLAKQPVGVLVGAPLPGTDRVMRSLILRSVCRVRHEGRASPFVICRKSPSNRQ